eukprot:m.499715 g.499715  ORF g.499715 m.499715 type:complete len:304 (+) comp57327_c0_seq4:164-1075(+)
MRLLDFRPAAGTECGDALHSLLYFALGQGEDQTDERGHPEYRCWQAHDRLVSHELLHEVCVITHPNKLPKINPNHHVHGTAWHDRLQSRNCGQPLKAYPRILLNLGSDGVVIMLRDGVEDCWQDALHKRVGAKNQLRQPHKTAPNLFEDIIAVVDNNPADPPTRHYQRLRNPARRQDRNIFGEGGKGVEGLAWKHKLLVDLIRNNRHSPLLRNLEEGSDVVCGPDRAAGVGGVVDDDGCCVPVNARVQLFKISLPVLVGEQRVSACLDASRSSQCHIQREPRRWNKNVLPGVHKNVDGEIDSA